MVDVKNKSDQDVAAHNVVNPDFTSRDPLNPAKYQPHKHSGEGLEFDAPPLELNVDPDKNKPQPKTPSPPPGKSDPAKPDPNKPKTTPIPDDDDDPDGRNFGNQAETENYKLDRIVIGQHTNHVTKQPSQPKAEALGDQEKATPAGLIRKISKVTDRDPSGGVAI